MSEQSTPSFGEDHHEDPVLAYYIRHYLPMGADARRQAAESDLPHSKRDDALFATIFALGWHVKARSEYVAATGIHATDWRRLQSVLDGLTDLCLSHPELQDLRDLRDDTAAYLETRRAEMLHATRLALAGAFGSTLAYYATSHDASGSLTDEQAAAAATEASMQYPRLFQQFALSSSDKVDLKCRCFSCVAGLSINPSSMPEAAKEVMKVVHQKYDGSVASMQKAYATWLVEQIRKFTPYLQQMQVNGDQGGTASIEHSAKVAHDFLQSLGGKGYGSPFRKD